MFYARVPRFMRDGHIRLRPLRVFDAPYLRDRLRDKDMLRASGLSAPVYSSWPVLWWWIKKRFMLSCCIEHESQRIGFVGLYNLRLAESAEITLAIFDKSLRHHGYGSRAFRLFAENLRRRAVVRKLLVRVRRDNFNAVSFWKKLGFSEVGRPDGIINMYMDLD